ncbi:MAG: hypothetical protein V1933_08020 [Candidatus Omnitrophota bacterium]
MDPISLITGAVSIASQAIPLIKGNKKPPSDDAARNERIKASINEVLNIGLSQFPQGSEEYNRIYQAVPHFNALPVYTGAEYDEVESFVNSVIKTYNAKMEAGQSTFATTNFKPTVQKETPAGLAESDQAHSYQLLEAKINGLQIPAVPPAQNDNFIYLAAIGILVVFLVPMITKRSA